MQQQDEQHDDFDDFGISRAQMDHVRLLRGMSTAADSSNVSHSSSDSEDGLPRRRLDEFDDEEAGHEDGGVLRDLTSPSEGISSPEPTPGQMKHQLGESNSGSSGSILDTGECGPQTCRCKCTRLAKAGIVVGLIALVAYALILSNFIVLDGTAMVPWPHADTPSTDASSSSDVILGSYVGSSAGTDPLSSGTLRGSGSTTTSSSSSLAADSSGSSQGQPSDSGANPHDSGPPPELVSRQDVLPPCGKTGDKLIECVAPTPKWSWKPSTDVSLSGSTDDCKYYSVALGFSDSPLVLVNKQPHLVILTPEDTNGFRSRPGYALTADPFLLYFDNKWTLFVEIFAQKSTMILYAEAPGDTEETMMRPWTGARMGVLSSLVTAVRKAGGPELPHFSFPYVFVHEDVAYMIPQITDFPLTLFKATKYPDQWSRVVTIWEKKNTADSQIIQWNNHWYIFTTGIRERSCYLIHAPTLLGPWKHHPKSPYGSMPAQGCRGGGRIVPYGDELVMIIQRALNNKYGTYTQPIVIETLTPTDLVLRQADKVYSSVASDLFATPPPPSASWSRMASHHVDFHRVNASRWMFVYDGREPCSVTTQRQDWADQYGLGVMP